MSDIDEKKPRMATHEEVTGASVALAAAVSQSKPELFSRNMLKLWLIMGIGYLVSTMNGFDSSLMGAINDMTYFQASFGLKESASSTGLVFITYQIGQVAAFPFCGLFADGLGRRWCIFIGCALVLVGTAIQTPATSLDMFIGGRFVLGFGASIASAAAPAYTVELAHPAYRGFMAGMYNNFWWIGNIIAGWTTYGAQSNVESAWAWRIPTLVQAVIPGIIMCLVMFLPESPRWLIAHDRTEEGLAVMAKYHGEGDESHPIVQLQYREIIEQQNLYADKNAWWDYRELYNTRAARYRLFMVIAMAFIGQWSGNNVISYFMPKMFEAAGIANADTRLLLNAINPIFSMIAAVYGASLLDKLGRRPMMLWGLLGALISYIFLTAFTAASESNQNMSYGVIIFIYLFGICFAWGFTPLQTLYSVECLENRTRAKGSGLNFLFLNVAIMVNTYGISEGMAAIGWRLYIVYIVWIVVEIVVIYFFFVETAGKTLEEMSEIFEAKNPRKASTQKRKIALDQTGNVLEVNDVTKAGKVDNDEKV
jgi:sugar porter (SP) family MFS transporter